MNLFSVHYMHSFSIRLRKAISSHSISQKIQMAETERFQRVDWISQWGRKHCFQINFLSTLKISRAICLKILPIYAHMSTWAFGFHTLTIKYKLCCDLWWLKGSGFSDRREKMYNSYWQLRVWISIESLIYRYIRVFYYW